MASSRNFVGNVLMGIAETANHEKLPYRTVQWLGSSCTYKTKKAAIIKNRPKSLGAAFDYFPTRPFDSPCFGERINSKATRVPTNASIPPQKNACLYPSFRAAIGFSAVVEAVNAAIETKIAKLMC